ncbi:50S ribosomal protein L18 [Coccomyxa sp. Obi]|nr:50S ribosomal protein L18 [Coccomyxa sp. Obi]
MQTALSTIAGPSCFRTGTTLPLQRQSFTSRAGLRRSLWCEAAQATRKERTQRRHQSVRNKVEGRSDRPRLAVYRSNNHIYAQVIDDSIGNTLVAASTLTPEIREKLNGGGGGNTGAAELVGRKIGELCLEQNISAVSFDRGGNVYHGRVKALADAAREAGLGF